MSDNSDESEKSSNWVFYKDRPEWKDVQPLPQDDGEHPVVSIAYSKSFQDVYDYFRAIVKLSEKSERALQLTKDALNLNAANYSVWQYRREILKALNKDLNEELDYIAEVIEYNPKNYQVWHHRRLLIEWMNDPSRELEFTGKILQLDAKNYHAWQHRQWVIKTFKLFDKELDFVDSLLEDDIRNNSAWNQRFFVITNTVGLTDKTLKEEIAYTLEKINKVKENESAWNYLRGLLLHEKEGLSKNTAVTEFCEKLYDSGCRSPLLLSLIVDMCDEQVTQKWDNPKYTLERALALCKSLAEEYDTIRAKYWNYMASTVETKATMGQESRV